MGSDSERFVLALSPGNYELIRVQVNEGPFLSIARLASGFLIGLDPITYLGTWRFGVDSPKYAAWCPFPWLMTNMTAPTSSKEFLLTIPSLDKEYVTTALPDPPHLHARLFEVMPYPRVPRYFRRHWW